MTEIIPISSTTESNPARPLGDLTLDAILAAIVETGTKIGAATRLGISHPTVNRYLKRGYSDGRKFTITPTGYHRYTVVWPEKEPAL